MRRISSETTIATLAAWTLHALLLPVAAHTPVLDGSVDDWCLGISANTFEGGGRTEDSAATLSCGSCSNGRDACLADSDCVSGQACADPGDRIETVWWDGRTDAAVNDLATLATTQDGTNLYFVLQQWGRSDPVLLPMFQIAIDSHAGGLGTWHDPLARLATAGTCSNDRTRACTGPFDCHFCARSNEPPPSTRRRVCGLDDPLPPVNGSGVCSDLPGDVCQVTPQSDITCDDMGTANVGAVGLHSGTTIVPDYLLVIDLGWFIVGGPGPVQLLKAISGAWSPLGSFNLMSSPSVLSPKVVTYFAGPRRRWLHCFSSRYREYDSVKAPCQPRRWLTEIGNELGTLDTSAEGGRLFSVLEFAIPWSAFGCAGCPLDCDCPGFGPRQAFRYTGMTARDALSLDYAPDGPIEDVFSEAVAGSTTASTNSCPGTGPANTDCELADGSHDAFIMVGDVAPGGRSSGLVIAKTGPALRLDWHRSCSLADVDYEIYAGRIGDFSSHAPLVEGCSTAGATTTTLESPPEDTYYLVVPTDAATEGSYGVASDGSERSASLAACRPQSLGNCPAR